jgi:hypothetical protein
MFRGCTESEWVLQRCTNRLLSFTCRPGAYMCDEEGRIFILKTRLPEATVKGVREAIDRLEKDTETSDCEANRRGDYRSFTTGISMGGGRVVSGLAILFDFDGTDFTLRFRARSKTQER